MNSFTRRRWVRLAGQAAGAITVQGAVKAPDGGCPIGFAGSIRDRLWVIATPPDHAKTGAMTPAETALYFGVPNLALRTPPKSPQDYHQFALSLSPFKQVVWPIHQKESVADVLRLLARFPGFTGVLASTPALAEHISEPLGHTRIWVDLESQPSAEQVQFASVVVFRTRDDAAWLKLEKLAPAADKILACPLWDESQQAVSRGRIQNLCGLALKWMRAGRINGLAFDAGPGIEGDADAEKWIRRWVATAGEAA